MSLFKLFSMLIVGLYIGNYVVSEFKFDEYLSDIDTLRSATNLETISLQLTIYTRLLDMERRGIALYTDLNQKVYDAADMSETFLNDIKDANIDKLNDRDTITISYNDYDGYVLRAMTVQEAVSFQVSSAQKITEQAVEDINIRTNSLAFWVHENGRLSIGEALKDTATQLRKKADETWKEGSQYSTIFLLFEICLAVGLIIVALPSLQKSDRLHMEVISVFYTIPYKTVDFLIGSTSKNLSMMQNENYPDNKLKAETHDDIFEELGRHRQDSNVRNEESFSLKRENLGNMTHKFWFKAKLLLRNALLRRLIIFCITTCLYSTVLQIYVGQQMALDRVNYAAKLTEYIGYLTVCSNSAFTNLMNTIDAASQAEVASTNLKLMHSVNGTYLLESIEDTYQLTMGSLDNFNQYINLMRVGNDSMHVPYRFIDEEDMVGTYNEFFEEGCSSSSPSDCESYYYSIFTYGVYSVVSVYCQDIAFVINSIVNNYYESNFETRWAAFEADTERIIKLNQDYLSPSLEAIEEAVVNYFDNELAFFSNIRIAFLAVWIICNLLYFLLVMRKAVMWHEKKKKLVREMLLLLPFPVVRSSEKLQTALTNLNLS